MKLLIIILLTGLSQAQAPDIAWQKLIGGSEDDIIESLAMTTDGGYILGGRSSSNISGDKSENSFNGQDYWVIKLNSDKDIEWQRTLGGITTNSDSNEQDFLSVVKQTTDGGYIIGGWSDSGISGNKTEVCRGQYDYWIIKLDNNGITQWQKVYGGDSSDELYDLQQTIDGGYILGGDSGSSISGEKSENSRGLHDCWIIKIDEIGNIQWQKTIGGNGYDSLHMIKQTADGGYIAGGRSNSSISGEKIENSYGGNDYWVFKLDGSGNIQWQKTIGGSGSEELWNILITHDGGYFICGESNSPASGLKTEDSRGNFDYWVLKLDDFGNIQWQKTIGGSDEDDAYTAYQCSDDGYVIAGFSKSGISGDKTEFSQGNYDAWIVRLDTSGTIQWQKTIGGSQWDGTSYVQQTSDGGFILGSSAFSSMSGDITETNHGNADYWLLKLNPEPLSIPHHSFAGISLWPNPTTGYVNIGFAALQQNITVKINNVLGQEVSTHQYENTNALTIPMSGAAGIYFLTVKNANGEKQVFKVVKD